MVINTHHGVFNVSKRIDKVRYIVLHYVGSGTSRAGNALANCKYFAGGNRNASAHYFIDDSGIWEYADPTKYYTWHCGDGNGKYGITNGNSIGIEVCINGDNPYTAKEISYLKELVPDLMRRFSVPANHVVRHYDASRKMCPYYYAKRSSEWGKLRNDITSMHKDGWVKESGKWHYYLDNKKVTNAWRTDTNGWCYLDANGEVAKDKWVNWKGNWYYLNANGYMVKSEWVKDSKGWCYVCDNGKMMKSAWFKWKGDWYYLDANGHMLTNEWKSDSVSWCYLGADGKTLKNKWLKWEGSWYYLDANGYMVTGEQVISNVTYIFESNGKLREA